MRSAQRVIKYFALALAAVIIIGLASIVVGAVSFAGFFVWGDELSWNGGTTENSVVWGGTDENTAINNLKVEVGATSFRLVETADSKTMRVESNNKYIVVRQEVGRLVIEETKRGIFNWGNGGEVVVYVPKGMRFDGVRIEAGAGLLEIEKLVTATLDLDLGAGKTHIEELEVTRRARIDGGAGYVEIRNAVLNNLDLDLGVGKADVRAKLIGDSRVDTGVGKLDLALIGKEEDYKIAVDKGIGSVTLDGRGLGDGATTGNGANLIKIESGIGSVEIKTVGE